MKEIIIDSTVLRYKPKAEWGDYSEYSSTEFYIEQPHTYRKGFLGLFGEKITTKMFKYAFTIYADCTNPTISKDWWRAQIRNNLATLKRAEELKRGELV